MFNRSGILELDVMLEQVGELYRLMFKDAKLDGIFIELCLSWCGDVMSMKVLLVLEVELGDCKFVGGNNKEDKLFAPISSKQSMICLIR